MKENPLQEKKEDNTPNNNKRLKRVNGMDSH